MISRVIFLIVTGIFALKVLWNLFVAYYLAWELIRESRTETRRVSLIPIIEFLALGIMVVVDAWIDGEVPVFGHRSVLLFGLAAIAISYVNFFVVGSIGGYIASRSK